MDISQAGIRQAGLEDLDGILKVIDMARAKLRERGIPQWQNGDGPSEEVLRQDIARGECYVLEQDGVIGTAVLTAAREPAYEAMADGQWLGDAKAYISIHRVAIAPGQHGRGYAKQLLQWLIHKAEGLGYRDIRIDTHPCNHAMQRTIAAVGFVKRGNIVLNVPDGERVAYQYGGS